MPYSWTVLWPGLARLWLRGHWSGLGIALLFGGLLNGVLVTTFLWPRIIGTDRAVVAVNAVGWFVVLCFWGASAWTTWRILPRLQPGADARGDDALFLRAQTEYLCGHWYEAEKLLLKMLGESPRDADAHLMLATLYRHTRRYEEARQRLAQLERLEGGSRWLFEIDEERRRLARLEEQGERSDEPEASTKQPSDDVGESPQGGPASKAQAA